MTKKLTHRVGVLMILLQACCSVLVATEQRDFKVFDASYGLADNSAQTIKCTKTGRMVITTIGHVNFYDGNTFAHIDPTPEDVFPLPGYNGHYHLYFDKHHHLWLKDKQSVTCVDLLMERFIPDVGSVIREMGVTRQVDDMFGDQNNLLWFRLADRLICPELDTQVPVADVARLLDIDVFDNRILLQFFSDGMTRAYDVKTGSHLFDAPAFQGADTALYSSSTVLCPYEDGFYQIRNGEKRGILLRFDVRSRSWTVLMELPYHLNNMVLHDDRLYIASEYGYWVLDPVAGTREHVGRLLLSRGRYLETDINALEFDRQGGMWVGTERRGLLYARPYSSPFAAYDWQQPEALRYYQLLDKELAPERGRLERRLNCICEDSRGWTWKGTYTGLQLLRPDQSQPEVYTMRDGLPNDVVHCIVEDASHDIWIGTSYGISHIFIRDGNVKYIESYAGGDDVPSESFANGRALKLADGTIVMQSLDHMVVFNPSNFHDEELRQMKIYPKLVRVLVNGIDVKAGMEVDGKVVLDRAVTRVKHINVNYDQSSISLTFSGLNYMRPLQTYYRVRVRGVHGFNDWRVLSYANSGGLVDRHGMLHLPLMGIAPGSYEVEVQVSVTPDEWLHNPYRWIVNVEEPWWRTTGVYISLAVLVLALLLVNFLFYNRNLRLRMLRHNEEEDILHRVKTFAERCDSMRDEVLTPYTVQKKGEGAENNEDFLEAMAVIVPYINSRKGGGLTMGELAAATGMDSPRLYDLLSNNLYKSPRLLMSRLRLQEAARLLVTTTIPVEHVAEQCHFVSSNFFIASFYHHYRQTPVDYRNSAAR